MSPMASAAVRKVAERVARDVTAATLGDVRKLARAVLMMTGGKP